MNLEIEARINFVGAPGLLPHSSPPPDHVVIAMKGSFHGKTCSSLKVTFNKSYREPYEGISAIKPEYVDPLYIERVKEIAEQNTCNFYYPLVSEGKVQLRCVKKVKVIALIMETIIGEGGIKPIPEKSLQYLSDNYKTIGIPYIIDEIQTGCGRTGYI